MVGSGSVGQGQICDDSHMDSYLQVLSKKENSWRAPEILRIVRNEYNLKNKVLRF